MLRPILLSLLYACLSLQAADFEDFQAARAVIGQPSFSAHDKGVNATALSISKNTLYVADISGRLFGFDLSRIGSAPTPGCPVCVTTPQSTLTQNVFQGVAAVALNGHNIAIADTKNHQVMLWKENASLILTGFTDPTSVALDNQHLFVGDAGSHHVFIWNQLPTSASQLPDVTLGIPDADSPSADSIQTPSALASDGTSLYVADSSAHRVLVFSTANSDSPRIVNAASLRAGPLAPGTLISIDQASAASAVFLNGLPLRVTDTSGDQLQVQIPYELNNASSAALWLQTDSAASRPASVRLVASSPGIFAFGVKEPRTGLVLHAPEGVPLSPEDPAKPSELLSVWATGLGAVESDANSSGGFDVLTPVHAVLNGNPVEVVSAALPTDATGVYEVTLRLPADLSGTSVSLVLFQNDSKSNAVTFPISGSQ